MFDPTKPVQTRDGRTVRIIATDVKGTQPIVAIIQEKNGNEAVVQYQLNGQYFNNINKLDDDDLVNVPEKYVFYVNVYKDFEPACHKTKELADKIANPQRIACVRVECEEGQYDD